MAAIFAFKCSCCGEVHEGSPSFAFHEPTPYAALSEKDRQSMAELGSDLCTIKWPDRTDYFVRAVLEVPIIGVEDPFTWGMWSSLSEKSFKRYTEGFDEPEVGEAYFGWLSNILPCYPATENPFALDVVVQRKGMRPKLQLLQRDEVAMHPLVIDQRDGISVARAQALAEELMHGVAARSRASSGRQ